MPVDDVLLTPDHGLSRAARADTTADLLARAHRADDPAERERLLGQVVVVNVRIAHAVAARYRGRGVSLEDLEQAACEGLVKAVHRFDPAQRHDLLTFAVPTIRGEVLRYFRDQSWTVRPPRRVQELQWRISRATEALGLRLGREPLVAEVCEELGIARGAHDEAVSAFGCFQPASIDQPLEGHDQLVVGGNLADDADPESAAEARAMLAPVIRRLSDPDRRLLYLRFLQDRTQHEIGEELGVPQTQVSRRLGRILETLRDDLAGHPADDPGRVA